MIPDRLDSNEKGVIFPVLVWGICPVWRCIRLGGPDVPLMVNGILTFVCGSGKVCSCCGSEAPRVREAWDGSVREDEV